MAASRQSYQRRRRSVCASNVHLYLVVLALVHITHEVWLTGEARLRCTTFVNVKSPRGLSNSLDRVRLRQDAGHFLSRRSAATDWTYGSAAPEESFRGPAELRSVAGQKVQYLMSENPMLIEGAIEQEFALLQQQEETDGQVGNDLAGGDNDNLELRLRFAELRRAEREISRSDLLYMMVCDEFRRVSAPLSAALPRSLDTRASLGPEPRRGALTESLHSPQVLRVVMAHLQKSLPQAADMRSDQTMLFLQFPSSQAYAMSVIYGYVIRRTERRFNLERSFLPESEAGTETDGDKTLGDYLDSMPLDFQGSMLSLEAQLAMEAQVEALFGDLAKSKSLMIETLKSAPRGEDPIAYLQKVSMEGKYPAHMLTKGDFHRLLLEAIAFGVFLCEAEARAQAMSSLTPAIANRLEIFGIDTEH